MDISPHNIQYLDEQVARGVFASRAEALDEAVHLLRDRQALHASLESIEGLEDMLLEGRAGPFRTMTDKDWEDRVQGIRDRNAQRQQN